MFIKGKVYGGDNGFSWVGTYAEEAQLVKARVNVHNFDPAVQSVFGITGDYELYFSGNIQGDVITGTAMLTNQSLDDWRMMIARVSAAVDVVPSAMATACRTVISDF